MKKLVLSTAIVFTTLMGAAGCAVTGGQSSVGQYVDDSGITARVKAKFAEDKTVAATRISVETLNGVVQLSGFARSEAERDRAVELARATPDVKGVRNSIIIAPGS
jgi:osmotically-inducible protein OsmY